VVAGVIEVEGPIAGTNAVVSVEKRNEAKR